MSALMQQDVYHAANQQTSQYRDKERSLTFGLQIPVDISVKM